MLLVEAARFLFNINDAPVAGDTRSENKELFFQLEMGDSKIILFPSDEVSICLCIYFGIFRLYMSCSERELKSLFSPSSVPWFALRSILAIQHNVLVFLLFF